MIQTLIQLVMAVMAVFIILLVLVQRGRGGGLAGALGGPGGSSAFGAKAGDTFTRITVIAATTWIVFCLIASLWAANRTDAFGADSTPPAGGASGAGAITAPADESETDAGSPAAGAPAAEDDDESQAPAADDTPTE